MVEQGIFKQCRVCKTQWSTRDDFLRDPNVVIIGYQAVIHYPERGLYLFNHLLPSCNTSLAIKVDKFTDLYKGKIHPQLAYQTEECPGTCLALNDFSTCNAPCRNAYILEIIQIINIIHRESVIRHK